VSALSDLVYLPRPREIRHAAGSFTPRPGSPIVMSGSAPTVLRSALRLQEAGLGSTRMRWALRAGGDREHAFVLGISEPSLSPQGYRLRIDAHGVSVAGADPAGLFHGVATLAQILRQCPGTLPAGEIVDAPDFPVRGVMLDISRDKVPSMDTLFSLVDLLSSMKVNHLELYTEHTFAYARHREVWADASPMTGEEILLLDAYCRERFIDLVPNQNSFGHLERWLALPRYRELAECPGGFPWPWGGRSDGPFSLDPLHPGSLALLDDLYADLLPHFSSALFNVGCDETVDLGLGRSRELCERRGKGRVYLDFLLEIHKRAQSHGRTMLYWGDIIMQYPELVPHLPRDAVALEWGYEVDHPFDEHGGTFSASGVPWWVCPGTSSWNSVAGRTSNCLGNIRGAARAGLAHGASGFLNTDWGDNGHWQTLPVSWLGFAAGAALSWCFKASEKSDFKAELDAHVFRDPARAMGAVSSELGDASAAAGKRVNNESLLFKILRAKRGEAVPEGVTKPGIAAARRLIEGAASKLDTARMERADGPLVRDEFASAARLLAFACDRGEAMLGGSLDAFTESSRAREELRAIIGEHRRLWMERNRVGGLADSVRRFAPLLPAGLQA